MAMTGIARECLRLLDQKFKGQITQRELEQGTKNLLAEQMSLGIGAATEVRR